MGVCYRQPRGVSVERSIRLTNFGARQLALFFEYLELARPRLVVVLNAIASRIYEQVRGAAGTLRFDEQLGCHFDTVREREVPVFFCGFPSYTDTFTTRRLAWHIGHVLRSCAPD
ncbi:hypothetical protein [Caldimonas tepidiphila]|uniref:hypothetical protein n=1 Tax=Caldimonas tepidiphila TaxID=2315841 RepID=UPI000E5A6BED|nr:hypothetical protein [Caldimonas tepidiphila]